ncbi:MAG: hypothetical protein Q8Q49_05790 [bacterium]|nr:hypothetical protein [bacterium]
MLTKDDLKAIKEIVASGNKVLLTKITKTVDDELSPLKREVHIMKGEVDELAEETGENDTFLRRRMKIIEDHIELPAKKR